MLETQLGELCTCCLCFSLRIVQTTTKRIATGRLCIVIGLCALQGLLRWCNVSINPSQSVACLVHHCEGRCQRFSHRVLRQIGFCRPRCYNKLHIPLAAPRPAQVHIQRDRYLMIGRWVTQQNIITNTPLWPPRPPCSLGHARWPWQCRALLSPPGTGVYYVSINSAILPTTPHCVR